MAHEVESLSYSGKLPWHGIGFEIIGETTPAGMLKSAKLDWTVSKRPMVTANHKNFATEPVAYDLAFQDLFALVRDSDNKILGVCGPQYQPFQNSEVFDFFNKFTEAGHMKMEVAGSLKGGHYVWALARLEGEAFTLMNEDKNFSYLLMLSPHVWGEALTILFTSVRVVCWNTLTQAMNKKVTDRFRYIHNTNFADVKALAELSVEQAMINKAVYEQKAKILAETKIFDISKLYNYIAAVVQPKLLEGGDANPIEFGKVADQIHMNYRVGPGCQFDSSRATWWGAFNAVTYFYDHQFGRTGPDMRLYDSWAWKTARTKRLAFDLALTYAQAA